MKFDAKGKEIGRLVEEKNKAYGDSFAKSSNNANNNSVGS